MDQLITRAAWNSSHLDIGPQYVLSTGDGRRLLLLAVNWALAQPSVYSEELNLDLGVDSSHYTFTVVQVMNQTLLNVDIQFGIVKLVTVITELKLQE